MAINDQRALREVSFVRGSTDAKIHHRGQNATGDVHFEDRSDLAPSAQQSAAPQETVPIADQCRSWTTAGVTSSHIGKLHHRGECARCSVDLEDRPPELPALATCAPQKATIVTD